MKLIKKQDKKLKTRHSALDRARRRLEERKAEIALNAMPRGEYFTEQAVCARAGLGYTIVWFREEGQPLFKVDNIVKDDGTQGKNTGRDCKDLEQRQYSASEFVRSGSICPWCGAGSGLIYCECGVNACKRGVYTRNGQRRCEIQSCGCDIELTGVRKEISGQSQPADFAMEGRKQARIGREKRPGIGRDKRAAIGKDKKPLLGWKKGK